MPRAIWGVAADARTDATSYNAVMTSITSESITTESIVRRPSLRSARQSILGFVAGLALASTVAVGINVTSNDQTSSKAGTPAVSAGAQPSTDTGCRSHHGPC